VIKESLDAFRSSAPRRHFHYFDAALVARGATGVSRIAVRGCAAQRDLHRWTTPLATPVGRPPRRARRSVVSPLSLGSGIITAIRRWRARVRSRQQLRELSDYLLSDIGLRRELIDFAAVPPPSHRD
jgi:uncharacterized protein YjiS (DUF1127 family)